MSDNNIKKLDEYVVEENSNQKVSRSLAELSMGIPKEWKIVRLYDYVNILKGYAFSSRYFNSEKRGLPLIRIRDLGKDETEAYYDGPYEETYLVKKNDILVSMDGEFNVFLWRGPTGLLNQRVCKIWSKDDKILDNLFLYYVLQKPLKSIEAQISQTTVKHLLDRDIKRIKIPLPPIGEQRRIAEVLSTVDEAIRLVDESIARTERLKKGLMQELLTKGIGHKEFKDTEIGRIPKEWEVFTVKEMIRLGIIEKIEDGNHGERHPKSHEFTERGVPFITVNCIKHGKIDFNECKYLPLEVVQRLMKGFAKPGDVLLTHKGTIGLTAIVPGDFEYVILSPQVTYYRIKDHRNLLREFLYYLFQADYVKYQLTPLSKQSTRAYVSLERQGKLKLPLPPPKEQEEIIKILSTIDKRLEVERRRKEKLKRIKKALMDLLLTGKIRVKV